MEAKKFTELLASVESLAPAQSERLREALTRPGRKLASLEAIEAASTPMCAFCESERVMRNGRRGGLQRWLRKDCGKTSNATIGTPLSRLRDKELFAACERLQDTRGGDHHALRCQLPRPTS